MGARGLVALVSACCFSVVLGFTVDCDRRDPVCLKAIQELNLAHNLTSIHEALKTTTNAPASETTFVPTALPPISPEINISEIAEIFDQGSRAKALEDIMEKEADTPMKILNLSSKGRALNLSLDDLQSFTNSLQNHTSGPMEVREISSTPTYIGRHTDLSDVSLDNDDNMDFQFPGMVKPAIPEERVVNKGNSLEYLKLKDFLEPSTAATADPTLAMCKDNNVLYQTGDKLQRGCEEICICTEGLDGASASWECAPRCLKPYFRKGRGLTDPLCSERAVEDPCCAILVCAADDSKTPKNPAAVDISCFQNNVSHSLGSTWNVGCEKVCTCGPHNNIGCKPRCPPIIPLEHCVNVQDPADACCLVQLCDVSQDVHEEVLVVKDLEKNLEERRKHNLTSTQELHNMLTDLTSNNIKMPEMASSTLARDKNTTAANTHEDVIISVDVIRNGTVKVNLARTNPPNDPVHLQISSDNGKTFSDITLEPSNFLMNLKVGEEYVLKAKNSEKEFKFTAEGEFRENETDKDHSENETNKVGCHQDGAFYEVGMEFNVGCTELCECTGPEQRECAALRCPSSVGLDVLDPGCVRWAFDPPSFVPHPPHCCAERMRCLSNGSCQYEGHEIPNWSEVPISLTGCERRCFCESGSLDCQSVCESVPAQPPPALRCAARQRPGLVNVPGDDCCKQWGCIDVGIMVDSRDGAGNRTNNVLQSPIIRTMLPSIIHILPKMSPHFINIQESDSPTLLTNDELREPTFHLKHDIPQLTETRIPPKVPVPVLHYGINKNKQILSSNKNFYKYPGPYADPYYIQKPSKARTGEKPPGKLPFDKDVGHKFDQQLDNLNRPISLNPIVNYSDHELVNMPEQHIDLLTSTSAREKVQSVKLFTPNINSKTIYKMSSLSHSPKNGTVPDGTKYIAQKVKQQLSFEPLQSKVPNNYQKISSSSSKQGVHSIPQHNVVYQKPINPTNGPQYLYVTVPPPETKIIGQKVALRTELNDSIKYQAHSIQNPVQSPPYQHHDSYIDVSDNIHHIAAAHPYVIHPAQQHYPNVQISQPASTKTPDYIKQTSSNNLQPNFDRNNTIRNNYGKTTSPITANFGDISSGHSNPTILSHDLYAPQNHALYHHETHVDKPKEVVISNTHTKHHPEYEPIDFHAILRQLYLQQTNHAQMTGQNDLTKTQTNEDRRSKGNDRLSGPTQNHNFVLPTNVNQFNGHPIFLPTVSPNNDFLPNVKEELIPESNDIRPPPKNKPSKHDSKPENPGVNDVAHHEENEDNEDSGSNEFDTPVFHQIDSIGDNRLTVLSLKSDSPTSLKMLLGLPAVLVGLRGRMDLRYTDSDDDDVSEWESQVFAPADEVLGTARLEFRLTGLQPHTEYKVRAELLLHRMDNGPISGIYTITTQDEPPVEEIRRPIDGGLNLLELNSTSADLGWRHFSMEEQKYIDGIQIRYRPVGVAIYSTTELLHRSRVSATLVGLRADTHYEAALVLAPLLPPAPRIELYDERVLNFHTPPIQDMYNWSVILEATEIGSQSALVRWRGVAEPPERFVSVYRAAHACEGDNHNDVTSTDEAAFKLPSREDEPTLRVVGLQPGTRCRVWLELFLTNGKTKTSNVLDILTKPTDTSLDTNSLDYSREATSAGVAGGRRGDYYVPLVAVAVVAALGALSSLLLLLVLLRRHRPHSVSITSAPTAPTAPRALPTLPPYENPAYKLEYQQETMDL